METSEIISEAREACKTEFDLIKIFVPENLQEGLFNCLTSCYFKGANNRLIQSLDTMKFTTPEDSE